MPASPGFKKGVNSGSFILVFVCFLITSTISFYLHIPGKEPVFNNFGLAYSDIVSGVFNPIFKDIVTPYGDIDSKALSERWYDSDTASKLLRSNICPVPYKDYRFEYPPIVALLWYISTCIAIKVALPTSYTSIQYYSLVDSVANVHYYVQSAFIITFLVVLTIYMYRIALTLGISWKRVVMFLFLPSTVLYLVYNWDIIAAAFAIVSLYYLMHKKYLASGIALGLSISTKVIPAVFAFIIVYDMIQKVLRDKSFGNNLKLFGLGLVIGLLPYIGAVSVSYTGFLNSMAQHAHWYCENCVYNILTGDPFNPYNRAIALVLILVAVLVLMVIDVDYENGHQQLHLLTAALIVATALNYVFSPQMMIMVTAAAVLALNRKQILFLSLADISNFGIMALFFKDSEIRAWLNAKLGLRLSTEFSPWTPGSPVQMLAIIRNVILILILIDIVYRLARTGISSFNALEDNLGNPKIAV